MTFIYFINFILSQYIEIITSGRMFYLTITIKNINTYTTIHQDDVLSCRKRRTMKYTKLTLTFFTSLIISSLIITSTHALSPSKGPSKTKFVAKPSSLAAKSFAVRKFGRHIKILSNRFMKSSGCYRIVIKTKSGNRETLKICEK